MSATFTFLPTVARSSLKCSFPKKSAAPPKVAVDKGEPQDDSFDPTVYLLNVQVSLNQEFIAVSTSNDDIKIYSSETLSLVSQLKGHTAPVTDIKFSMADAHVLASSSDDGSVVIWDVRSGAASKILRAGNAVFKSVAISDTTVAAGTAGGEIAFWDLNSDAHYVLQDYFSEDVGQLLFHPTSPHILFAGSYDGLVVSMDTSSQVTDDSIIDVFNVGTSVAKMGLFGSEAQFCYTLAPTEQLQVWDVTTSSKLLDFGFDLLPQLSELTQGEALNYIIDCKYDVPNDKLLIFAGSFTGAVHVFVCAPEDGAFHHLARLPGHSGLVRSAWYDQNSMRAITVGEDSMLFQWASPSDPAPSGGQRGVGPSFNTSSRSKPF